MSGFGSVRWAALLVPALAAACAPAGSAGTPVPEPRARPAPAVEPAPDVTATEEAPPGVRADAGPRRPAVVRPVPAPVVPIPGFREALERDTRSPDGSPGPRYWRNHAVYDIDASLDPATGRLSGRETVRYLNRSPHTLDRVVLHLHQNLHAEGVRRMEAQEVTGGVDLGTVRVGGREVPEGVEAGGPFYIVEGTLMVLGLPDGVDPGDEVELEIEWEATLPRSGAGRMGWSEREMYYVAYWFPKVGVYDDVRGWDAEPYLGAAEFYDEFGDYDVRLTVPAGWTAMATGELRNGPEVYRPEVLERVDLAASVDTVVTVASTADLEAGRVTTAGRGGRLTYRFTADSVRDFTWTTSDAQRWDATSAVVPDRDGDGRDDRVTIHTFWREDLAPLWSEQARYAKQSVEFHSRYTGYPYPWPHMTSVEGHEIIGGGMEHPMLTIMGSYRGRDAADLFNVTSHEIAHMWIPMIVGTNEKRYAWMDEGSTTFLENQSRVEYYPGTRPHQGDQSRYLAVARAGEEQPLMRHGDYYEPGPGYGIASYAKPASLLVALRHLLGRETFERGYRTFIDEWAFRHPTPWDLFNTFERVSGRDLDWWWTSFYSETWTLDHAAGGVVAGEDGARRVVVEDRGWAVAPATVVVHGSEATDTLTVPVREWLAGRDRVELPVPEGVGRILRVEVGPDPAVPDVDRSNDVWEAPAADAGTGGDDGPGRLVIVGGSLDADNDAVYRAVVEGREGDGPICVLPTASGVPERSMESAMARFAADVGPRGVEGVFVTEAEPSEADDPELAARLEGCSGFWFTGGSQSRIVDVFLPGGRETAGYRALMQRHRDGAVVAGSSAGAAMMSARMIAGGGSDAALRHGIRGGEEGDGVWVRRGMGFLDGAVVDQHFLARGRVGRLVAALLAGGAGDVGVGIDENTALVLDGSEARVVGESGVLLVVVRERHDGDGGGPAGEVAVHLLGPGDRVDLDGLGVRPAPGRDAVTVTGAVAVEPPDDLFGRWAFLELLATLAASSDDEVEIESEGYRVRLREGPGFRASTTGAERLEATPEVPGGLSAGPFLLTVEPTGRGG